MPRELFDPDEFMEIMERAIECRVKRKGDVVKLKLRTKHMLYTLKVSPEEAEVILSRVTVPVVEV